MSKQNPSIETSSGAKKPQKRAPQSANLNAEPEIGGFADQNLPEPTRFGDWEVKGRCSDF